MKAILYLLLFSTVLIHAHEHVDVGLDPSNQCKNSAPVTVLANQVFPVAPKFKPIPYGVTNDKISL